MNRLPIDLIRVNIIPYLSTYRELMSFGRTDKAYRKLIKGIVEKKLLAAVSYFVPPQLFPSVCVTGGFLLSELLSGAFETANVDLLVTYDAWINVRTALFQSDWRFEDSLPNDGIHASILNWKRIVNGIEEQLVVYIITRGSSLLSTVKSYQPSCMRIYFDGVTLWADNFTDTLNLEGHGLKMWYTPELAYQLMQDFTDETVALHRYREYVYKKRGYGSCIYLNPRKRGR